jgi:hypothetical protein
MCAYKSHIQGSAALSPRNSLDFIPRIYSYNPASLIRGRHLEASMWRSGVRRPRACLASMRPGRLGSPSAPITWGRPCQGWTRTGRTAGKPAGIRWAKGPPSGPGSYGPEVQNRRDGALSGARVCARRARAGRRGLSGRRSALHPLGLGPKGKSEPATGRRQKPRSDETCLAETGVGDKHARATQSAVMPGNDNGADGARPATTITLIKKTDKEHSP